MVSSFHPHSMCKKVGRVTTKIKCTSCTKWTVSFEVSGFHMETRLLQRDFIFWTYLNSRLFLCSKCTIQSHIINFQPFLTSFDIFRAFTDFSAIRPWNWKALQMNSEKGWKLAWCHRFTHIAFAKKLRGLRQKLDALRLQTGQSLSKYSGFWRN